MADVHGELRTAAPAASPEGEPVAVPVDAPCSRTPSHRPPARRHPVRVPGVGRRTTRVPRTPRPLTHRRPAWRALGRVTCVAAAVAATAAVGTAPALAWAPDRAGNVSPVPVDAGGASRGDPPATAATCDAGPNAFNLAAAFGRAVRDLVARQTPRYQDGYYGLTYGYNVTAEKLSGSSGGAAAVTGTVSARYRGTAYEKASGKPVSRSGTATATFQWSGCSWVPTRFQY
ncbi:MAG TPA: hypothetical protein VKA00_01495 [Trueperaceae bacterium]|nr:hypothetical protein [Trueperaceae bacterium]